MLLVLPFNQQCIEIYLKNLQEPNRGAINSYTFRIDCKEGDINKCREVLPVILYLAGYYYYAVLKKNKWNSCKDLQNSYKDL